VSISRSLTISHEREIVNQLLYEFYELLVRKMKRGLLYLAIVEYHVREVWRKRDETAKTISH